MSILIGHASIDENGKASGGQAGDSTKKEVCTRQWYSKPWQYYLECTDENIANIAATYMEQICANDNVGYDQSQRLTLYNQLKSHKDISKLTPCECDCSSLVACCYIMAGLGISSACTTRNIRSALLATGKFKEYSDTEHLTSDKYAKRGGLYLKEGSHVVMALENGIDNINVTNKTNNTSSDIAKGIDVSGYNVISDYQAVKNTGVQFAILKIIRKDLTLDKLFETHLNGFNKVNIPVIGVYNYSYATTVSKSKSDAEVVVKYLKQYKLPTSTVVYMDVEDKCQQGLGSLLVDMINSYQAVIENAGYKFGLYTGLSFWNSNIKPYESKLKCNVEWIARYKKGYTVMSFSENPSEDSKPNIGREIEGYQYTSSGQVNGVNGNVDLNILYSTNNSSSNSPSTTIIKNIVKVNTALNVRNKPNGTVIGKLKNGDEVKISNYQNGWFEIGKDRWVSADYIHSPYGIVTANVLNIRSGAGVNYQDIGDLNKNENVRVLKESNGWYLVLCGTRYGWASAKYIQLI